MKHLTLAFAFVAGLATALPAAAQFQRPEQAAKYRQSAMVLMVTHLGRVGAMVNNRVPFDAAQAAANADIIATVSRLPFQGFVEGSAAGTKAKPEIWTERAKFDAAAAKMQEDAQKLNAAAKTGDAAQIRAAFTALSASCSACHDAFRAQ